MIFELGFIMKERTIYALGFFDGVHLGHQALLEACRKLADNTGCAAGVVTFIGHPQKMILGKAPRLINTYGDRKKLLAQFHMDKVVELFFDEAMMHMPWQDFFQMLLREHCAAGLVCGEDFHFGNRGEGTAEKLAVACKDAGIPCVVVPQQKLEGTTVSSTHIRSLLEAGALEEANRFLGHPHVLSGAVMAGRGLGRTIGIPTANLLIPEDLVVPKQGVYACTVCVDGHTYVAVTNIGSRPTVGGHQLRAECWLLDYEGDLYGREITVKFHSFLRPEQKFDSLEVLQEQIRLDAAQAFKLLR